MDITQNISKAQHPFVAGFWLIAAIPTTLMVLAPLAEVLQLGDDVYAPPGLFVLSVVHFGTGYL